MAREEIGNIILGAIFLFIGLAACSIAAIRRRSGVRIFVWLGIWSAMYGAGMLPRSPALVATLPRWIQIIVPYANTVIAYLIVVPAALAWLELSAGPMRSFLQAVIFAGLAIGLTGIGFFVFTGSPDKLTLYNNVLVSCALAVLVIVVTVPKLSGKYFVLPNRRVLAFGSSVFAIEALYANLARPLYFRTSPILDSLGFAVLLFSFGYVAVRCGRRLLRIPSGGPAPRRPAGG